MTPEPTKEETQMSVAERDDAMRSTAEHLRTVQHLLLECTRLLMERAIDHDASKWSSEEWPYFAQATSKLKGLTYGSPEYKQGLEELRPAIDHHQSVNRHHPEYFGGDLTKMSLIDLMEMLVDWKAATLRHDDGDILKSFRINTKRFNIPEDLVNVLENTIIQLGYHHED